MALKTVNEESLVAIGDAIRAKTGLAEALEFPNGMVDAVDSIETVVLPEEAYVISGQCDYKFSYGGWHWYLDTFRGKIRTEKITGANAMFNFSGLVSIPFDLNFSGSVNNINYLFAQSSILENIGDINNCQPTVFSSVFNGCYRLRYLPQFNNCDWSYLHSSTSGSIAYAFQQCNSLRSVPESLLKELYSSSTGYYNSQFYNTFNHCYVIDEIRGLKFNPTSVLTTNCFRDTFTKCLRVKDIIFATQEDSSPDVVSYKNQTIDLTDCVGYADSSYKRYFTETNSGLTADTEITADTYEALKDHPDGWTANIAYSRYNHDSAVNTINSLPDTSAYLASAGGTNTIKFKGSAGSATDGGAINTLTEAEIAVATAKGWTISLV